MLVAFEVQHHVDEVLERPGTGDGAVLRDVADQEHGHTAGLGECGEGTRHRAHLRDAADDTVDVGGEHRLYRVDDQQRRAYLLDVPEDGGEIGLGREVHAVVHRPGPVGAQPYLPRRFLAGDVERALVAAALRPPMDHLEEQRRLADAGFSREQHDRTGNYSAAEDAVEFVDTRGLRVGGFSVDPGQRGGRGGRQHRGSAGAGEGGPGTRSDGRGLRKGLVHRPPCSAFRASADPFPDGVRAVGTAVERLGFDHCRRIVARPDRKDPGRQCSTGVFRSLGAASVPRRQSATCRTRRAG